MRSLLIVRGIWILNKEYLAATGYSKITPRYLFTEGYFISL